MKGKTVGESSTIMTHVMTPQDVNIAGNVHGGVIMMLIDSAAGAVAIRHARKNAVTASVDRLDFYHPVYSGDLVTLKADFSYHPLFADYPDPGEGEASYFPR